MTYSLLQLTERDYEKFETFTLLGNSIKSTLESIAAVDHLVDAITVVVDMLNGKWYQIYITPFEQYLSDNITKTQFGTMLDLNGGTMLATIGNENAVFQSHLEELIDDTVQLQNYSACVIKIHS